MMTFCIDAAQLRAAVAEIEAAEKNGFMHCLAVMKIVAAGPMLDDNIAHYSDMIERAHAKRSDLDWGRGQHVSRDNRFDGEKLVPLSR